MIGLCNKLQHGHSAVVWKAALIGMRPLSYSKPVFQRRHNEGQSWGEMKKIRMQEALWTWRDWQLTGPPVETDFPLCFCTERSSVCPAADLCSRHAHLHVCPWVLQSPADVAFITELRCLTFVQTQWLHKLQNGLNQLCHIPFMK